MMRGLRIGMRLPLVLRWWILLLDLMLVLLLRVLVRQGGRRRSLKPRRLRRSMSLLCDSPAVIARLSPPALSHCHPHLLSLSAIRFTRCRGTPSLIGAIIKTARSCSRQLLCWDMRRRLLRSRGCNRAVVMVLLSLWRLRWRRGRSIVYRIAIPTVLDQSLRDPIRSRPGEGCRLTVAHVL